MTVNDPDAPPAEKLKAWLAEQQAAGAMERPHQPQPSRAERIGLWLFLVGGAVLLYGAIGWAIVRAVWPW